ncbi:MAG: Lysophospholipase L1-like protein esterase [Candidatus Collierbacteria bacterium GW2011_GWB1_45_35]|uniref:Lysophospholipase L1-like protein esterase n=1 Tax=Candidatus Collierbacteria bacterium GW2011_GWA2_44_99 TaxID=1618380 RepID=A0A0G1KPU2_9BACT|nr:MAG: Lysophospholipase L1-like protein esterase [Microgenomates group bacterium GW2011_GWC1_44_23]KKT85500.1 MAG: Lysophospholipase L1-like protein esterase [Candidatus Collierbacteria bacterium GW2011_GWA2_44_99]KKT95134.1 MAG: Lysophospholipase L1-like protein esterase [Candidatus Collierbacteria bacterium GW2011_GWA1_45_15]KKU04673.1 MAG: Lysophospholipase L1-like protein esterase [Candidatus Collierbacteria bacterium GW2011_GWB1_45_35]KKU07569.1 MAG: Lysophospholipase L1-like protein est
MSSLSSIKETLTKNNKYYIAFVGDSITSCEWVHPNWRDIVIYVLQQETNDFFEDWRVPSWGIRGFNFGYDGATTRDIESKLPDILSVKPDIVISVMGGNDPIMGIDVSESGVNSEKIIDAMTSLGIDVVWSTSIASLGERKNHEYEPYAFRTMQLVDRVGFQKINLFEKFKNYPMDKFFTFMSEEIPEENVKEGDLDMIHPNQLGNAYIAKIILKEAFGIEFDPEKYIADTLQGQKYPGY